MFVAFTNGTLFNAELADKLQKLGNVVPMFSLEGFEKETDARRGAGTFNKVMEGMDLLKGKRNSLRSIFGYCKKQHGYSYF